MISWDRVNELRNEIGEEDFGEVVQIFLEEADEVIARLEVSPEPAKFEDDLHFLKGCALNLGFEYLSQLCQSGERDAAGRNPSVVNIAAVIAAYTSSRSELLANPDLDLVCG